MNVLVHDCAPLVRQARHILSTRDRPNNRPETERMRLKAESCTRVHPMAAICGTSLPSLMQDSGSGGRIITVLGGPCPVTAVPSCSQAPAKNVAQAAFFVSRLQSRSGSPLWRMRLCVVWSNFQNGMMLQKCFSPPATSFTMTFTRTLSSTATNS
jgi:hypothetical protein